MAADTSTVAVPHLPRHSRLLSLPDSAPSGHYNSTHPTSANQTEDGALLVGILTVEGLIGAGILFTNALVLIAFQRSKKLRSTTTNVLLLQLAVVDFTAGLFVFFHIAFALEPILKRSEYGCVAYYSIIMHVCTVSMLSLIGISIDRFVAIVSPMYHRRHKGKRRTKIYCLFIHFTALLVCVILPFAWHNKLNDQDCEMVTILNNNYIKAVLIPIFLLMVVTKFTLYCLIYYFTQQRVKMFRRFSHALNDKDVYQPHQERAHKQNVSLAKTGALVVSVFIICWLPFFVVLMMQVYGGYTNPNMEYVRMSCFLFILLCSLFNPIIYILRIHAFRKEILVIFKRAKKPTEQESSGVFSYNSTQRDMRRGPSGPGYPCHQAEALPSRGTCSNIKDTDTSELPCMSSSHASLSDHKQVEFHMDTTRRKLQRSLSVCYWPDGKSTSFDCVSSNGILSEFELTNQLRRSSSDSNMFQYDGLAAVTLNSNLSENSLEQSTGIRKVSLKSVQVSSL